MSRRGTTLKATDYRAGVEPFEATVRAGVELIKSYGKSGMSTITYGGKK